MKIKLALLMSVISTACIVAVIDYFMPRGDNGTSILLLAIAIILLLSILKMLRN